MTKLTLSVDAHVVTRAKRYAETRGVSVSHLVETLLDLLSRPAAHARSDNTPPPPPVLAKLRGSLRRGAVRDYQRYLEQKYR